MWSTEEAGGGTTGSTGSGGFRRRRGKRAEGPPCTAELQPGLVVAGGRDPRDTETRGRSLPHSARPTCSP